MDGLKPGQGAWVLLGTLLMAGTAAQIPDPLEPADGAVTGPRPVFKLSLAAADVAPGNATRLMIEIAPVRDRAAAERYERPAGGSGWLPGEDGTVLFRPPRPLPDGEYTWIVARWNGVNWDESGIRRRLRVDSIAPADVEGLDIRRDLQRKTVRISWRPVTLDRQGGSEFVARYHVYRFPTASSTPQARPYLVASTEATSLTLPVEEADEIPLWFYRVTAEDLAGNEAGRID